MFVTKLSSKGQIVIPQEVRKDLDSGTTFAVTRKNDLIVLKKLESFTEEELKEMEQIERIWKEIDAGKATVYDEKEFFKRFDNDTL